MNDNKLNLSEKEEKYLLKFEKYIRRIYINYISVGLLLCTAIVGLIVGITTLDRKGGFLMAIIFGGMSVNVFLLSRSYQKLYTIINKMKQYIAKLESEK